MQTISVYFKKEMYLFNHPNTMIRSENDYHILWFIYSANQITCYKDKHITDSPERNVTQTTKLQFTNYTGHCYKQMYLFNHLDMMIRYENDYHIPLIHLQCQSAIPKIKMLFKLYCLKARLRLLCNN